MARIAVVDNEQSFLEMLDELLTKAGHTVITHCAGDTSFAMIRKQRPDLVILDMRMEHPQAGWMILDRMRIEPLTAHIPVLMCTEEGCLDTTDTENLVEEGACVLVKPFTLRDILTVVARALDPVTRACRHDLPVR